MRLRAAGVGAFLLTAAWATGQDTADLSPETGISEGSFTAGTFGDRAVWVPNNPANMLYFRVPGSFDFVVGTPVYVRIEYHDSGRGRLFAEYDSNLGSTTADRFRDAEIHARSSRVGQDRFVYNYQMFESPLFARRQNGANDFRFMLQGSDGTPLRIASVQISTIPYGDERFLQAVSKPWLTPYTGPVKDFTDSQTLSGKVMVGYQGWFATPNDASDKGWIHWGRSSSVDPSPTEITVDMWPWLEDYHSADLYPAGSMVHQDGRPAYLFSSRDPATVQRHFRWMRKYDIDGAYVQRFVSRSSSGYYGASEFVLNNVKEAANKEGRVWAIEYDVSSLASDANPLEVITNDWNFLVNECDILSDPRYVHEDGKPVLFIWGFSVPGREGLSLAEADAIIDSFGTNLYLIGGVHSSWESNTGWYDHYQKYDQLLAWMERTRTDLVSQKARLDGWGMKILPHAWPGFSWNNLQMTVFPQSYTARAGGAFYWDRLYNAVAIGADQIFLGMFDEYDEGTAIMPMSDNHPDIHTGWGHYLDNEGRDPFWYLRLSGAGRAMLNGFRPLSATLPLDSAVSPGAYGGEDATAYLGTSNILAGLAHTQPADGLTSGAFVGGHNCRTNGPDPMAQFYFYFDLDDAVCFQKADGQAATVEIEFYDNKPGTRFRLQYDGLGGAYVNHPDIVDPPDSGGWKNIRWNITDGYFGNRQNGLSDFRIALFAGESAVIRRVSVFLPEEQDGDAVADAPRITLSNGTLQWPATADAAGWRLVETDDLTGNSWQAVAGPFTYSNGMVLHPEPSANGARFYKLKRAANQ
ncbi:MAG: glycoside hydrolase family 71/99-like protein [Verrucomicrobia bacterium]|nr:glycoside hydrolase family 71/99-like protein [Verrucomicrobiota bacterium]